jgi:hypothetical protein
MNPAIRRRLRARRHPARVSQIGYTLLVLGLLWGLLFLLNL